VRIRRLFLGVLLEVCRQLPWYRVDGSVIAATPPQSVDEVLSDSERMIFKIFKQHGPVLQRAEFEELCLEAGMNRHSFWIYLIYSPVITRYASGVYGLRGADVPAGLVERLIRKRPSKSKVVVEYGWTGGGSLRIVYRVSPGMLSSGIVSLPASLRNFLNGKFVLMTADNASAGTLVAKNSTAWGLGPFFRRRGGEPGDYLSLIFDLSERVAVAQIGDVNLIEQSDRVQ
jgi:hypothetical protein